MQGGKNKAKQMANIDGVAINLPQDLIFEILKRLPPKDISRFRCVSKLWYRLLSRNEEFIARHAEWSRKNPLMLIRSNVLDDEQVSKNKTTIRLTSVDMNGEVADEFKIVVDGLIYRVISCGSIILLCTMTSIYVCNPTIHETVSVLPKRSRNLLQNIGFGFDPSSRLYKIVHLFKDLYSTDTTTMHCEVLAFCDSDSLNYGSWRRRYGVCARNDRTDYSPLCLNGNIYWAQSSDQDSRSIISFSLKGEEFSTFNYPPRDAEPWYNFQGFTAIKGSLCVIRCFEAASRMDVWKLDMNDNTWVIEHSISLFPFAVNFLVSSVCQTEDIVIHTVREGLVWYDIKNQTSKRLKYFEGKMSFDKPCLYSHSLSPLNPHVLKSY